jgi:hypothetical protein
MANLASVSLLYGAGVGAAISISWLFLRLAEVHRVRSEPPVGSTLRIRAASGIYRSQLERLEACYWTISAPLQRDHYVPLRVGEELVIEAATDRGALLFRGEVVERRSDPHVLVIQRPKRIHAVDRRDHRRWPHMQGAALSVEGEHASVVNLSEGGARLQTSLRVKRGERVRIDMPCGREVFGWVLATEGNEHRIRFEELIEAPLALK